MGIALWLGCALVVFFLARLVPSARPARWAGELFAALGTAIVFGALHQEGAFLAASIAAGVIRICVFGWEFASHQAALGNSTAATHQSSLTIRHLLPWLVPVRRTLFVVSTIFSALAVCNAAHLSLLWAGMAFASTSAAQIIERYEFFTTVRAPRMPGGI